MGKQTDKKIKDIVDAADACVHSSNGLCKVLDAWPAVDDLWDKFEPAFSALGKDWETHPYIVKRYQLFDAGKAFTIKLKSQIHDLNMALVDFRSFIAKKEKSKNPFKSKASLPSAKQTVKLYQDAHDKFTELMLKGSSTFRG